MKFFLPSVVFLMLHSPGVCQLSIIPRDDFWIADGEVNAIVVTNGLVYIGGNFQNVGPQRAFGADVNGNTGGADFGSAKIDGAVTAVASDGNGGWLIARSVPDTNDFGLPRSRLMRVPASKSVDPIWDVRTDRIIYVILATNDRVYVGGQFGAIGGSPRRNLASLDLASGQPLPWDPSVGGEAEAVRALAVSGQTLYAGGGFSSVGGIARQSLAAIDTETGAPTSWNPRPETAGFAGSVLTLGVSGTNVYVGGGFNSIGGSFRTNLAAVSSLNGFATSWNPNPDGLVDSLAISSNTLFVTGTFTGIGGVPRESLASIDLPSGMVTAWNPSPMPPLQSLGNFYVSHSFPLLVKGDRLFVGGSFTNISGQTRSGAASFDLATGGVTPWNPYAIAGQVTSLAAQGNRAYIGGFFRSVNGVPRRGLAALDETTGVATSWQPSVIGTVADTFGAFGTVRAMAVNGQTLYLGGNFTQVGALPRTNLAAVEMTTGQVTDWNPGANGAVSTLALGGTRVYVGGGLNGGFTVVANQSRTNLAAIDFDGIIAPWDPAVSGRVEAMLVAGNTIYVGGSFNAIGGIPRTSLAAVDAQTGGVTSFSPAFQAAARAWYVYGLAFKDGALFTAGFGVPSLAQPWFPYLASWNPTNSTANWEMAPGGTASGAVSWGLASPGDTLYAGTLSAFNAVTGVPQSWTYSVSPASWGAARVIAPMGDSLIVGGNFNSVSEPGLCNLAVFPTLRPVRLGAQLTSNGATRVEVSAEPGIQNVVQSTTNFLDWTSVTTNSGSFFYDDANVGGTPARFYRALRQP